MKADDRLSGLFLMISGCAISLEATRYNIGSFTSPGEGLFPLLLGLFMASLSFALFISGFWPPKDADPPESLRSIMNHKKIWYVMMALILYGLILERLGFLLATFFLFTLILRVISNQKLWICTIGGVAASAGCYTLFSLALGVLLPKGIFGP